MRKIISAGLLLVIASFIFTACEKADVKPPEKESFLSSAANRALVKNKLDTYFESKYGTAARGQRFITPFFTNDGFGILDFTNGGFAGFSTELDDNDFYRENNDGTVSVHISSNNALAEYIDFNTGAYLFGEGANFTVNYTGVVIEIPIGPGQVFKFIDFSDSRQAVTAHGVGWVDEDGTSGSKKLSMKVTDTPSGQVKSEFTLK